MKNTLILIFALATVALGALGVIQLRRLAEQQAQVAALRSEVDRLSREEADLQASHRLLEQQRRELFEQSSQLADKLQTLQRTSVPAAPAGESASDTPSPKSGADRNPFGQFLARMMEDPDTKKFIRDQQKVMVDQSYGPLARQLGLSPEETEQFKKLIAENMGKGAERATALLGGESATNRTQMLAGLAEEQTAFEEQVRALLGESRYFQYKDYQQTIGERTQLNQFRQQMSTGEGALTDQQTEQLLAFMKEEKQTLATAGGLAQPQDDASMQAMLSGEGIEKSLQVQEAISQRVYERARSVLSENQLAAFGRFQTNQTQMMRMGMNMARKYMFQQTPTGDAPPSNQ